MTVEVRPFGVTCNIQCQYCYQNPQRDAGNLLRSYDLDKIMAAVEQEGGPFTLFGGEPLLMPKSDLERLWAWGYEKYGRNTVQTNGTLIDDDHIRMFKAYRVSVGVSIDGPGALNDVRWGGSLKRTRENTAKTEAAIERLCREGLPPGLIVTLSRSNASSGRLAMMHQWFRDLESLGVTSVRLHVLESDTESVRSTYALSSAENLAALRSFASLAHELPRLKLDLFQDMRSLLLGEDDGATCVWNACDPYTTPAVSGIEGNGQRTNCGRTNKDGVDFVKASRPGFERYLALYYTPWELGGCKGCRFFVMCKGQCPGTAIDGDWRNRSEHCELWKQLFRELEEEMLDQGTVPLSADPLRARLEQACLDAWASGHQARLGQILASLRGHAAGAESGACHHGDQHGDHLDSARGVPASARNGGR